MHIQTTIDDHRIAKLAALAIALHMVEAVVPSPLPGVKPGIAKIGTALITLPISYLALRFYVFSLKRSST